MTFLQYIRLMVLLGLGGAVMAGSTLGASGCNNSSASSTTSAALTCAEATGETVEIATAKLIIEFNSVADDIGVHGAFDDHGYSELCVYDPSGTQVLALKPLAQFKDLTIAGIFFESREPPSSEFSFEDLQMRFPEGEYTLRGITFDGKGLIGSATFTHDVPAPPVVVFPPLATEEENAGDVLVSPVGLVIEWEDVTETVDGDPVTITGYEIIVTKLEHDDPHGFSRPIFDVHLPPDRNSLSVPAEFLEPGTGYELEVLALETSGNQTIAGGYFTTE